MTSRTSVCQNASPVPRTSARKVARCALHWLVALTALGATPAFANVITTYSQLQGWVNSRGGSDEAAPLNNTFTGNEFGMRFNSWAAFYIPAGTYTSASLSLTPSYYGAPGPSVIGLFDVTTPFSGFLNTFSPGKAVYDDLGSGRQYAAITLYDQPVTFSLNGRALADINSAVDHYFLIGFTNQTLNAQPPTGANGIYISGNGRHITQMELDLGTAGPVRGAAADIPEPASLLSMGAGLIALCGVRRRRGPLPGSRT